MPESIPQRITGYRNRETRRSGFRQRIQHHEVMDRAVAAQRRDFDAGFHQFLSVCLPFVTQHVILGRDDRAGGNPAKSFSAARNGDAVISLRERRSGA